MIGLIDQIANPVVRAFLLRVYNTLVAAIIAAAALAAGAMLLFFAKNGMPSSISDFANPELWDNVLVAILMSVITALAAGGKKADRVSSGEEEEKI